MSVTITAAGLVEVFPEWEYANTNTPAVVANAVSVANAKTFGLYTDTDEETYRRYLEASAILYNYPFARDMSKPNNAAINPYRMAANEQDMLKGSAYRGPGWVLPSGTS